MRMNGKEMQMALALKTRTVDVETLASHYSPGSKIVDSFAISLEFIRFVHILVTKNENPPYPEGLHNAFSIELLKLRISTGLAPVLRPNTGRVLRSHPRIVYW